MSDFDDNTNSYRTNRGSYARSSQQGQGAYQQGQGAYQQGHGAHGASSNSGYTSNYGSSGSNSSYRSSAYNASNRANSARSNSNRAASAYNNSSHTSGASNQPSGFVPTQPSYNRRGSHAASSRRAQSAYTTSAATYGAAAAAYDRGNYTNNSQKKKKRNFWTIVAIVAALVLLISVGVLAYIMYGYWHINQLYDDIAEEAAVSTEVSELSEMTVDWDSLLAINEDTIGWIYMPGTDIDYPIVQGDDDSVYLKMDFTGSTTGLVRPGSIFLSVVNEPDFSDAGNYIYGHKMSNGSMFSYLLTMVDEEVFSESRTFYILTPTQNYRCTTYAIDQIAPTDVDVMVTSFDTNDDLLAYVQERVDEADVAITDDIDFTSVTKLFSLITCGQDSSTTRILLCAAVVEQATPDSTAEAIRSVDDTEAGDDSDDSDDDETADDSDDSEE